MSNAKISARIESVRAYRERLAALKAVWDNLALLSQMNGDGANMQTTRAAFEKLAADLLENLAAESVKKCMLAMEVKAQLAIDVLVRNLYERSADIGFLCTDEDVRRFLRQRNRSDAAAAETNKLQQLLKLRFAEYAAKYSVYDNIALLAPDGKVLLQLTGTPLARSRDALIDTTLNTSAAYVETFRAVDLFSERRHSLVYSFRVTDDSSTLGILCLSFRFKDETDGIFAKLLAPNDWTALTLVDANHRVIASSDLWQFPEGATLSVTEGDSLLRFAGREYLVVARAAKAYQGYRGPDWRCYALVPREQAFQTEYDHFNTTLPDAALAAVRKNPAVFSHNLRQVPVLAETIQSDLNRTVWNGHVRIGSRGDSGNSFSKILLWEISNTGRKTQDVFEHAITALERTVVSTILHDCQSMAGLAVDILDRNLYERANDCRWWALDRRLGEYLAAGGGELQGIGGILRRINDLYTVYHTLVLFDAEARVIAVSNPNCEHRIGSAIEEEWARATLSLTHSQAYHVSPFETNSFYADRPTLTYGAAIHNDGRTVGGIGIVFDAAPQLRAMLKDALTRDDGSIAVLVDRQGRVLSASDRYAPGECLPLPPDMWSPAAGGSTRILLIDGCYYAVGVQASAGYREYPGLNTLGVVMIPLGAGDARLAAKAATPSSESMRRAPRTQHSVELASFWAGGHWLAVPLSQVIEAIDASGLHPLPEKVPGQAGYVMHAGKALLVADLATLLGAEPTPNRREIVLVRTSDGRAMGLLVEALGEIPHVDSHDILPSLDMLAHRSLTESLVRSPNPEDPLLCILSPDRVAQMLAMPRAGAHDKAPDLRTA